MLRRFFDRLRLPFRKDRELRSALFRILGFYPQKIEYYKIAFAHKSQGFRDKNGKPVNNERLEFLGDAVLESVISDILFHHFEKRHEGFLTATRSKIVQRESLNRLAKEMGIDKLIQTSTRNTSPHSHLGGNAFEALMGAIYLDKGYKTCQKFVQKQILGRLMDLDGVANKEVNFKSKLLEWCQKNKLKQDFVMRLEDNGKQKEPLFHCTVIIEAIEFGYGKGYSKKEAQQQAARETLTMLRRDENVVDSVFRSKEKRTAMEANEMAVLPKIDEIEDDLLREQQQPKRQQIAEPRKAEGKEPEAKVKATPKPKEKIVSQPQQEAPKAEQPKEQKPKQKVRYEKPVAEVSEPGAKAEKKEEDTKKMPSATTTETPKKVKKEAKPAPFNVASLAEAAIAEADAIVPHLPSVVEKHSTAVVPTEPARKREIVPAEDYKPKSKEQKGKNKEVRKPNIEEEQPIAPSEGPTTNSESSVAPSKPTEAPAEPAKAPSQPTAVATEEAKAEAPKKEKRPRHKVTRIAEYTKTEVKSEEEVEAERKRTNEEREEKRLNKRIKREANRAKDELEKLTQPAEVPTTHDVLAEASLEGCEGGEVTPSEQKSAEGLSNSAKRRLRRKRAAERAKLEAEAPAENVDSLSDEQPAEDSTAKPIERKKHQHGNSRKRRRQQATTHNEAKAEQATAEV
jgi:ribonuclease-3